jgi:hypothetical protein
MTLEHPINPEMLGEKQPREKLVRSEKALSDYLENNPATMLDKVFKGIDTKRELLRAIKEDVSDLIKNNEIFREAIKKKAIRRDTAKKAIIEEITGQNTISEEEREKFYWLLRQIAPEKGKVAKEADYYENADGYSLGGSPKPTELLLFPRSAQLRFEKLDLQPPYV